MRAAADFFPTLADRGVQRGEIGRRDREHLVVFVSTLLWGITTLDAFDAPTLDRTVAAPKWTVRRQLAHWHEPRS